MGVIDVRGVARIYGASWLAALALWLSAGDATAAPVCIESNAERAFSCQGKTLGKTITRRKRVRFSAPKADTPSKPKGVSKPNSPTDVTKLQPRHTRELRKIDRQLLWQEINNVTRLYRSTRKGSRDKPRLMRRLAEGYVELESAAFREQVEADVLARQLRRINPTRAKMLAGKARDATKVVAHARKKAIRFYQRLAAQHPSYCRFPSQNKAANRGCGDEVLYYLAYELEQDKQLKKARDVYLSLIDKFPTSKYIPNAYLAFGELYFNEAQGDPSKWPLAKSAYQRVTDYKPPSNKLWGYAQYKLGYVFWNQGAETHAIDQFKKVIDFGMKFPRLPNASGLTSAARRDIVPVYALKGDASKAFGFFQRLSGDRGGRFDKTFSMMEELGNSYMDTGHYGQAVTLYRDLLKRNSGSSSCGYHAQVAKATLARNSGDKRRIIAALGELRKGYALHNKRRYSASNKRSCGNVTASMLAETAMAWHLEAIGSGGVRGTMDKQTMAAAAKLYGWVHDDFSPKQFARFKFPHIVKQDWPTLAKVAYHQADLLYAQGRWQECAHAFDEAYQAAPKGPNAAEALFASAQCWRRVYDANHASNSHRATQSELSDSQDYKPKPFGPTQRGMLAAFDRYACNITPPRNDRDAMDQYVEMKFARARTYYEAAHYDKAALAFRDIALKHSEFEAGIHAGNLYLESLNIMYRRWDKLGCAADLKRDVDKLVVNYCSKGKRDDNLSNCERYERVARDATRITLEALEKRAKREVARGGTGANSLYRRAADGYMKLWKEHGKAACEAKDDSCKGYEDVLYNAAMSFQNAHLLAKAIRAREILLDPSYRLHETRSARKASYQLGANYQAIAVYDKSAHWYERFARNNPKMSTAAAALSDAVVLRLGLGQHEKALAGARLFNRQYGSRKPQQAAQIAFAIGAHHVARKRWRRAEQVIVRSLPQLEKHAGPEVKLQAFALLGKLYHELERPTQSQRFYRRLRDASQDVASLNALKKAIEDGGKRDGEDGATRVRRHGKALMAMGEALHYFANRKRAKADALVFPKYRGPGTRSDVDRFVKTKITEWMNKKVPAIKEATAAYMKIVSLNAPQPPPRWAIAAGAAIGAMWGELVDDFIEAPYPKQWDQPGYMPNVTPPTLWVERRAAYKAALAKKVAPYKKVAKHSFDECLEYGIIHQYFDNELRSCERWLSKKYPNEYHMVDEFRGSPTRVSSGLDERPRALGVNGKPVPAMTP
jgi:TolA-binding protein